MERANAAAKILEVHRVSPRPNSPTPASSTSTLSLSTFDWYFLTFPPTQRILFYPLNSDPPFFNSILQKLKHSLSLTLQHFLPLTGTLIWPDHSPKPFVFYSPNHAVSFTVAEIDTDFNHLSGHHARELKQLRHLVPTIPSSDTDVPIMAVQVTNFPNHGFCIGASFHHVLFDGKSVSMFFKAWAYFCKLNQLSNENHMLPAELAPSFERSGTVLETPFDFIPKNRSLKFMISSLSLPSNWFHGTFELTRAHIDELKKRVLDSMEKPSLSKELHLSTFVVSYAYSLICLMKAKQMEIEERFCIVLTADVRRLLDPPLSSNYFGNCLNFTLGFVAGREFSEGGFPNIAKKISDLIMGLRSDAVKMTTVYELQKSLSEIRFFSASGSPKFKLYETEFGWGKPNKVDMVSLGGNSVCLTDARDGGGGGGVEVGIVLPSHDQMNLFASLFCKGLN